MNKKLIMGLAIGICVIAVIGAVVAIVYHSNQKPNNVDVTNDPSSAVETTQPNDETTTPDETTATEQNDTTTTEPDETQSETYPSQGNETSTISPDETGVPEGQHEDEYPTLSDEQLARLGENIIFKDTDWLNKLVDSKYSYARKHHLNEITSIDIFYNDDAKPVYFLLNQTDGKVFSISASILAYQFAPTVEYMPTLMDIREEKMLADGFKKIVSINDSTNPLIIQFINEERGKVEADGAYAELLNLTINDLR